MSTLKPVLSAHWDEADSFTIAAYKRHGGYKPLAKALKSTPDEVIALVKESGLRARAEIRCRADPADQCLAVQFRRQPGCNCPAGWQGQDANRYAGY